MLVVLPRKKQLGEAVGGSVTDREVSNVWYAVVREIIQVSLHCCSSILRVLANRRLLLGSVYLAKGLPIFVSIFIGRSQRLVAVIASRGGPMAICGHALLVGLWSIVLKGLSATGPDAIKGKGLSGRLQLLPFRVLESGSPMTVSLLAEGGLLGRIRAILGLSLLP